MKQNLILVAVAILALTAGIFMKNVTFSSNTNTETHSLLNQRLPDLTGKLQALSQWQGKILIINFWATWCPPCLKEIPDFIALQNNYANKNVQFVGIAIEAQETVKQYDAKVNFNYPILIAGNSGTSIAKSWGNKVNAVPFTVILNQKGEIIHRQAGEFSKEALLKVIQPLLK